MGLLRVLLALSVAFSHMADFRWLSLAGGTVAVQAFYMISGFYMATILTEKYDPRADLGIFYSNRFLRIYSIYFVSVIISLAAYAVIYWTGREGWLHYVVHGSGMVDGLGKVWLAFSAIFVVGQDVNLFLEIRDGEIGYTPNGPGGALPVWYFMPVPQAWSISLELMFYGLVPFLIRLRTSALTMVAAASLALRLGLYATGFDHDPWISRFFPNELALFVMGMLARRLYDAGFREIGRSRLAVIAISFLVLTCFVRFLHTVIPVRHIEWVYYFLAVLAIPCLFELTRHSKLDQFVGNFSYPLYLIHWVVIAFYDSFVQPVGIEERTSPIRITVCIVASLVLSWIIVISVETPLDRFRQRRAAARLRRGAAAG